jgi:hypothetical protein
LACAARDRRGEGQRSTPNQLPEDFFMMAASLAKSSLRVVAGCSLALLLAVSGPASAHGGHNDHGSHNGHSDHDNRRSKKEAHEHHHHHHHHHKKTGIGPVHGPGSSHNPIVAHPPKIPKPVTVVANPKPGKSPTQKYPPGTVIHDHRNGRNCTTIIGGRGPDGRLIRGRHWCN